MKLNETEWDSKRQHGTMWDDIRQYGTTSNIYEKPNVFWAAKREPQDFRQQHFKQQPDKKRS